MVTQIAEMLGIVGVDITAPANLAEFFPWFLQSLLGFCMIAGFFQLLRWTVMSITKGGRRL